MGSIDVKKGPNYIEPTSSAVKRSSSYPNYVKEEQNVKIPAINSWCVESKVAAWENDAKKRRMAAERSKTILRVILVDIRIKLWILEKLSKN